MLTPEERSTYALRVRTLAEELSVIQTQLRERDHNNQDVAGALLVAVSNMNRAAQWMEAVTQPGHLPEWAKRTLREFGFSGKTVEKEK